MSLRVLSSSRNKKFKVYNNIIMLTVLAFVILLLSLCFFKKVNADASVEYDKSFISIEVEDGDTLYSIAYEYAVSPAYYDEYIKEVKNINNLNNDIIHSGCYLLIPVYSEK